MQATALSIMEGGFPARAEKDVYKRQEYVTWQRRNNLFFDEQTDEMLQKAIAKLKTKKENVRKAEKRLHQKVKKHQCEIRK